MTTPVCLPRAAWCACALACALALGCARRPPPQVAPPPVDAGDDLGVDVARASSHARAEFRAGQLARGSDRAAALAHFLAAAQDSPGFAAAQFNVAALLLIAGENVAAGQAFRGTLAVLPGNTDALLGVAAAAAQSGDRRELAAATALLQEHAAANPADWAVRARVAQLQALAGAVGPAHAEAVAVLHGDEHSAEAMLALGMAYRRSDRPELALLALDQALAAAPTLAAAHHERGLVLLARGERAGAQAAFAAALAAAPEMAASANDLGVTQVMGGAARAAQAALATALALRPEQPGYRLNLGNALRDDQQIGPAAAAYRAALAGGAKEALYNLGVLYLDNEVPGLEAAPRLREAVALLRRYAEAGPAAAAEVAGHLAAAGKALAQEERRLAREGARKARATRQAADE